MPEDFWSAPLTGGEGAPQVSSQPGLNFYETPLAPADSFARPDTLPGFNAAAASSTGTAPVVATQPAEEPGAGSIQATHAGLMESMWDGASGPFRGSWHAGRALLMDPAVRALPLAGPMASMLEPDPSPRLQEGEMAEAQRLGWEGAKFYGTMAAADLTGGMVNPASANAVLRGAAVGASAGGSWGLLDDLPEVMRGKVSPQDFVAHVSQAAAWGSVAGGAFAAAPWLAGRTIDAAKGSAKLADGVLSKLPGYTKAKEDASAFITKAFTNTWHKAFTSGEALLENHGLGDLAQQLRVARSAMAFMAGRHVADFKREMEGLDAGDRRRVAWLIENMDLTKDPDPSLAGWLKTDSHDLWARAKNVSAQLTEVGQAVQKAGVQVFDPETGTHTFALTKNYIPRRYVNPAGYREGGEYRDEAVKRIMDRYTYTREAAETWLDKFSDRLEHEMAGTSEEAGHTALGTSSYLKGRQIGLPGYETDLDVILPQYFEHIARRYVNHSLFGEVHEVEQALRPGIQQSLFPEGELQYVPKGVPQAIQPQLEGLERFPGGKGIPKEAEPIRPLTPEQFARKQVALAMREARRDMGIVKRYPRAFQQIAQIENPELNKLMNNVVRRQLGALDQPLYGGNFLRNMADWQVVTKLALGAVAQPSQMLSAIVRTEWNGALKSLWQTLRGDPEAMDFALRSGVTLRSVVRQSEISLTQGAEDFLSRVFFTHWDEKSRVFGALQGKAFAEHQASKMATLMKQQLKIVGQGGKTGVLQRQIDAIASKLEDLGISRQEVAAQGGVLNNAQLMKAAQKVSSDVNFWGDALSLPEFYKSPYGRYMTQFKSFGYQQFRMMKKYVVEPGMQWIQSRGAEGDIKPFIRMAITMPGGGELITDIKKGIRLKSRNSAAWQRVMENTSQAAGFGILWDFIEASNYQLGGELGLGVGPTFTELGKGAVNVVQAGIYGKPKGLMKQAIEFGLPVAVYRTAPQLAPLAAAAAPAVSNLLLPPGRK